MDLLHVRRGNHQPQTDPLPGALPALWRYNVRDLELALPADEKGLGALTRTDDLPCATGLPLPGMLAGPLAGAALRRHTSGTVPSGRRRRDRKVAGGERGRLLDNLTIALCLSIGTGVPWLIAIYTDNGARQLIGNNVLGLAGTVLAASAFNWISPTYGIVALITFGPAVAFLTIIAGQAVKRAILSKLSRSAR
jgi:hypothetical protein